MHAGFCLPVALPRGMQLKKRVLVLPAVGLLCMITGRSDSFSVGDCLFNARHESTREPHTGLYYNLGAHLCIIVGDVDAM